MLTRDELYLVETETEEETENIPQTLANNFSRNVTKDKTDHTDETDQHPPALIVDIWRNMTEHKSGNKDDKKTERGNYSEDKKRGYM